MPLKLERLASRLLCPHCRAADWLIAAESGTQRIPFATIRESLAQRFGISRRSEGLRCRSCGARYPREQGVLLMLARGGGEPEIAREREAARATERDPALGGIDA